MRLAAPRLFYRMCGLSAVVILLDQATKFLVFRVLMDMEAEMAVLPVFSLVKRYNTGISFSILATDHAIGPWVFALLAIVIAVGLLVWLSQTAERLPAVGLALVVGGAIGNVIDRLREGAVLDFLLFHWHELAWPAFNLADSAITIGVALLIYDGVFGGRKRA
ncbi:MAG TPA: signal peptidase II [Dongiaceae bacterium]|jgi:signal peptidase II|nr:signal peptidase II [Dongiaceae bacterium]